MNKESNKVINRIFNELAVLTCVITITAIFGISWFGFYIRRMIMPFFREGNWFLLFIYALMFRLLAEVYDTFKIPVSRISDLIYSQILALISTNVFTYIIIVMLCRSFQTPLPLMDVLCAQSIFACAWATIAHRMYFKIHPPKKTIIIWDSRKNLDELIDFYRLSKQYKVVKKENITTCMKDIGGCISGCDAVFLSGIHSRERNKVIKYCVNHNIDAYIIPRVGDMIMGSAKPLYLFHLPVVKVERYNPSSWFLFLKRLGDIILSMLALFILSPLMIGVAVVIKATDGGTVFYRQCRLTKDGKRFYILKFRSMRMDAEKDGVARLSTGTYDDRITPIGRFIRALRIDELPQLVNIIKGEMSIVGPRPERPEIFEQYLKEMPEFELRLQVKAGLTGLAQVRGRYNTTPYDKLLMDLLYIAHPSLLKDFVICLATIKILFLPESTKGITQGATTALEENKKKRDG